MGRDRGWRNVCLMHFIVCSSEASHICQEGQSERTFPIFAFYSRFFFFFPDFFPIFGKFFTVRGGTLPPLDPPVATPLIVWQTLSKISANCEETKIFFFFFFFEETKKCKIWNLVICFQVLKFKEVFSDCNNLFCVCVCVFVFVFVFFFLFLFF